MNRFTISRRLSRLAGTVAILGLFAGQASSQTEPKPGTKPATSAKKPSIYDVKADAKAQVATAAAKAARENKRVLLMFGGDWCGWCHKLHGLFASSAEIRRLLSYEYELVMIDTKAPHAPELLKECSEGQTGVGFPFLAVLDQGGKLLVGQKTDPLEEGDHHDPKKVKEFLSKWPAEPKDAEALLRDALARASSDDKKVFLRFGAPWCGWCHRLDDFLARPEISAILDRDFVMLKIDIDRMKSGKDVLTRYRPQESGIPWFVILDAKGEKLAKSETADGSNIGYPVEPKEIETFMAMITATGRRLEPEQIAQIRKSLEQVAEQLKPSHRRSTAAQKAEKL
jgi:thioredoxin-related protein